VIDPLPSTECGQIEPIRLTARIRLPIADAFRLFTEEIGSWWPSPTHYARGPVVGLVFEGRVGGRPRLGRPRVRIWTGYASARGAAPGAGFFVVTSSTLYPDEGEARLAPTGVSLGR
jgi:hypothetical protein